MCDGPVDGAEDIVCISGVFHEALTLKQGGVPGYYERDSFQFPKNPLMLIGWDKDDDGHYPPFDLDDVAVLDGSQPGAQNRPLAITNHPGNHSYIEIAHLTIRNYGHDAPRGPDDIIRAVKYRTMALIEVVAFALPCPLLLCWSHTLQD